jgi:ABC-type Fe3+/spermidine/putrescine transport system ATPase subunit
MDKIEVKDAVKKYGRVVAVDDVSFQVKEKEILSLLGPSGCGKTTVLRAIAGLEDIDAGEISLDGETVTSPSRKLFVPPEKRHLGLVFQGYALWPHMKVRENVAYGLKVRHFSSRDVDKRVKASLETVGLTGLEDRYPSQLSGGQQQRVALARNLAYEPKVLLLDEPLSNLDLKVRERTRGELHSLLKRIGITAMYVTHDQEEAFVISDRVILMKDGKMVQEAEPNELYEEPANLFVAEFIGRANILKASVKDINESDKTVTLNVPDMATELVCRYECPVFPRNLSMIILRHNEIGIFESKPEYTQNVIKGEVVSREYRGAITDHKVRVGNSQIIVTTHKFCTLSHTIDKKTVYLYIPPESIKPIPC